MTNINLPDNISQRSAELYNKSKKVLITDPEQAAALLEEALEDSKESRSVILLLADAYRRSKCAGKAIKLLENAIQASPEDEDFHHQLANAYSDRKWNKKANAKFAECFENGIIDPTLIEDYSEHCLDNEQHQPLADKLFEILEKLSDEKSAAMCIAMIYADIIDSKACEKTIELKKSFMQDYVKEHNIKNKKVFFADIIKGLSDTPNDISALGSFKEIVTEMQKSEPGIKNDTGFISACTDFELSLILYSNNVTPLTVLALRTAKLRYSADNYNKDELSYLVFDAKMTVINSIRNNAADDVNTFKKTYTYLWNLISDFAEKAYSSKNLKMFTAELVRNEFSNASPSQLAFMKSHMKPADFDTLSKIAAGGASQPQRKPTPANILNMANKRVPIRSEKIQPNAPCPCGSGKKYKKCCGLK